MKESSLWPIVEKWLKKSHRCFATAIDTGLKQARMDVIGVADTPGDLSGRVETIEVEVKKGTGPFAKACGQTLSYKVYANRVYLADCREKQFSFEESSIASHLGVGLVQIKGEECFEALSSPYYEPMEGYHLAVLEKLGLGKCQVCGSCFETGGQKNNYPRLVRVNETLDQRILNKAVETEKGLVFWNVEVAKRKDKLGLRDVGGYETYERRFICPDCVSIFLTRFTEK